MTTFHEVREQAKKSKSVEELREIVVKLCSVLSQKEDAEAERNAGDDW